MKVDWHQIDTVLLDMDGTLLDKHFDDYFWEHLVPEEFARENFLTPIEARKVLLEKYRAREGTLDWTDLDYWSEQLGLDIPALKIKVDHLIQVHPYVIDFLEFCVQAQKRLFLVTNAHSKTLGIKMDRTRLSGYFRRIVCAEEVGMPKDDPIFWEKLAEMLDFDKKRTLLAEDTENILVAAKEYGIGNLVYVARPSSRAEVKKSKEFTSIIYFKELIQ